MSEVMDETVVADREPLFTVIDVNNMKKIGYNMNLFINY